MTASPALPSSVALPRRTAVVVGAGGAIGSHVVPELGRMGLTHILLCDPDRYEPRNLPSQADPGALGLRKVDYQREVLRRIHPTVDVSVFALPVQSLPPGHLRCDLLLGCVDNRAARQHLSQVSVRWGIPYLDAGVEPDGLLARVSLFVPGPDAACLECGWSPRDYALLEQAAPCRGGSPVGAPTHAPSALAALAAAYQALEAQRLLFAEAERSPGAHQWVFSAANHRFWSSSLRRCPRCRFDHTPWEAEFPPRRGLSLAVLVGRASRALGTSAGLWVKVEGIPWVTRLECRACRRGRSVVRLRPPDGEPGPACSTCGEAMVAPGIGMVERLEVGGLEDPILEAPLDDWGVRPGDIVTIGNDQAVRRFSLPTEENA